jgi:hypothetical protein
VKIDALLSAQGWNVLDTHAVRFEVALATLDADLLAALKRCGVLAADLSR